MSPYNKMTSNLLNQKHFWCFISPKHVCNILLCGVFMVSLSFVIVGRIFCSGFSKETFLGLNDTGKGMSVREKQRSLNGRATR